MAGMASRKEWYGCTLGLTQDVTEFTLNERHQDVLFMTNTGRHRLYLKSTLLERIIHDQLRTSQIDHKWTLLGRIIHDHVGTSRIDLKWTLLGQIIIHDQLRTSQN